MAVILFIFIIYPCHCAVYMYKIMILQKPLCQFPPNFALMWLIVYSNDYAPLTVRPIYSSSKLRIAQMMIFSLVAMIGLEKCCITSAYLQWLCHSGAASRGPWASCLQQITLLSYCVISATMDVKSRSISDLCTDTYDCHVAIVEVSG